MLLLAMGVQLLVYNPTRLKRNFSLARQVELCWRSPRLLDFSEETNAKANDVQDMDAILVPQGQTQGS